MRKPDAKTGTLLFEKLEEAVKDVYKGANDIFINFYNRESHDLTFNIYLKDEFNSVEMYRLSESELNELIVKYLEKKNIKVKMTNKDDYSSAHIYFDNNVMKFTYI